MYVKAVDLLSHSNQPAVFKELKKTYVIDVVCFISQCESVDSIVQEECQCLNRDNEMHKWIFITVYIDPEAEAFPELNKLESKSRLCRHWWYMIV